ncbi:MAG TPA: hypothetical protein VGL39_28150 [Jatrophihabitantaceae bacterium]|jgi:hypothetical protein
MSDDRPDLPTFDGRDVREHAAAAAEAVRAINHITGWPHGMTYPSDAYSVLSRLAAVAAMLRQAFGQIDRQLAAWHAAGHVGIDRGTPFAGNPSGALATVTAALDEAAAGAEHLYVGLDHAGQTLSAAHWTGPDPYVEIVDDRDADSGEVND